MLQGCGAGIAPKRSPAGATADATFLQGGLWDTAGSTGGPQRVAVGPQGVNGLFTGDGRGLTNNGRGPTGDMRGLTNNGREYGGIMRQAPRVQDRRAERWWSHLNAVWRDCCDAASPAQECVGRALLQPCCIITSAQAGRATSYSCAGRATSDLRAARALLQHRCLPPVCLKPLLAPLLCTVFVCAAHQVLLPVELAGAAPVPGRRQQGAWRAPAASSAQTSECCVHADCARSWLATV